jgi:polar amino acid transport system permease protein
MEILARTLLGNTGQFAHGLLISAEICLFAYVAAVFGGLSLCLIRLYVPVLRPVASLIMAYCRSTPIFVQLMWVAYAWYELLGWPRDVFTAAWVALALQSAGYLAETFRAGIEGIERGQTEAAMAIGMGRMRILRRILLPQALIIMAPSLMNQFVVVVKCSTLVSVIAVPDLMYEALRLTTVWNEPVGILSVTAAIYVAVLLLLAHFAKRFADRLRLARA